jgi:hypothetical protein
MLSPDKVAGGIAPAFFYLLSPDGMARLVRAAMPAHTTQCVALRETPALFERRFISVEWAGYPLFQATFHDKSVP